MPKGSCEPNNDENLQRSDWKQKCIGHGHDCFHMEHCSLSPACSFIYIPQYLALFADGINLHCSGCLNSHSKQAWCSDWFSFCSFCLCAVCFLSPLQHFSHWIIMSDHLRLAALGEALKTEDFLLITFASLPPTSAAQKRSFHPSCWQNEWDLIMWSRSFASANFNSSLHFHVSGSMLIPRLLRNWKPSDITLLFTFVTKCCPTLCHPMDCSPPGSSVHEIFQAWVLKWVAISFSRGYSWLRDRTHVSYFCVASGFFTTEL